MAFQQFDTFNPEDPNLQNPDLPSAFPQVGGQSVFIDPGMLAAPPPPPGADPVPTPPPAPNDVGAAPITGITSTGFDPTPGPGAPATAGPAAPPIGGAPPAAGSAPAPIDQAPQALGEPPPPSQIGAPPKAGKGLDGAFALEQAGMNQSAQGAYEKMGAQAETQNAAIDYQLQASKAAEAQRAEIAAQVEANRKEHERITAHADALQEDAANAVVDPNRFRNSMSGGDSAIFWLSAAIAGIGGALDKKTENPVLKMLEQKINQDVQLQMDERVNKRALAKDAYAAVDRFDSFSKDDIAQRDMRVSVALQEHANDAKLMSQRVSSREMKAAYNSIAGDLATRSGQLKASAVKAAADEAHRKAQLAQQWSAQAQAKINADRSFKLQESAQNFGQSMAQKQYELEEKKFNAAGNSAAAEAVAKEADVVRQFGVGGPARLDENGNVASGVLLGKNKKPFLAGDKESAGKIKEKMADAMGVADDVNFIKSKLGHKFDIGNSKEVQEVNQRMGALRLKLSTGYNLGALSPSDLALVDAVAGLENNPTGWRDAGPALDAAAKVNEDRINNYLTAQQYDGERVTFPNLYLKPADTKEEAQARLATGRASQNPDRDPVAEYALRVQNLAGSGNADGITDEKRGELMDLIEQANGGSEAAKAQLRKIHANPKLYNEATVIEKHTDDIGDFWVPEGLDPRLAKQVRSLYKK